MRVAFASRASLVASVAVEAEALLAARILLRERRGSEKLMDDEVSSIPASFYDRSSPVLSISGNAWLSVR